VDDELRVEVDADVCVGAGQCALVAPDVFDQDDTDGVVRLLAPHPDAASYPAVREAAALCPSRAIRIVAPGRRA
jgi:ferredoxin